QPDVPAAAGHHARRPGRRSAGAEPRSDVQHLPATASDARSEWHHGTAADRRAAGHQSAQRPADASGARPGGADAAADHGVSGRRISSRHDRPGTHATGPTKPARSAADAAEETRRRPITDAMALVDEVSTAIADAMRKHDPARLTALRMLKAAFMNRGVEKG